MSLLRLAGLYGLSLAAALAALWAFAEVAEEAAERETMALNRALLLAIHAHAGPELDWLALALAALGSFVGIGLGAWQRQASAFRAAPRRCRSASTASSLAGRSPRGQRR